jgi:hypothetical protein
MLKKGYTPEQIINKLREAEILLSRGSSIVEASRKIGVTIYFYASSIFPGGSPDTWCRH